MIYLDYAATTDVFPEVAEKMVVLMTENFGNPSSLHAFGRKAEKELEKARERLSKVLKVQPGEIIFTAGGTVANNLAILGSETGNREEHFLTSPLEHSSVTECFKKIGEKKEIRLVKTQNGELDLEDLEGKIDEKTRLVSLMLVNNELGNIYPIEEIGEIIKRKNPKTFFHVDGIQALGKIPFNLKKAKVDLCSFSSHKIHGPKGMGALYIKEGIHLHPLILGGGQENGLLSGTENIPGIVGFSLAAEKMNKNLRENYKKVQKLKEELIRSFKSLKDVKILSKDNSSPYILSVACKDLMGQVLLNTLEREEIYISTGSACHKGPKTPVVESLNLSKDYENGVLRISLSESLTLEEIREFFEIASKNIEEIRSFKR